MANKKISDLPEKTTLDWWETLVYAESWWNWKITVQTVENYMLSNFYDKFKFVEATWTSQITITNFNTAFTPTQNFAIYPWTLIEWLQYVLRVNSNWTARWISLWTWISNPYSLDLTTIANKITTIVFLATSSSTLEIHSCQTAL